MTTIKIIQLLQLVSYLLVTSQLLFYLVILIDALRVVSLQNFLEQRKVINTLFEGRFKAMYYACLVLSLTVVVISIKDVSSPIFITSLIAFICLVADVVLTIKGNGPLNARTNTYVVGQRGNWEELRIDWLRFIKYRGYFSTIGMISLLAGLVF
jgi:hypothetical protein